MADFEDTLAGKMAELRKNISDLPAPETEEQRQALEGFNELARILGEMAASVEANLPANTNQDE